MQPTWFTVPWVQFQSLPSFTANITGLGGMAPAAAAPASNMGGMTALNGALNGMNGVSGLNGVNGLSGVTSLNSLGQLNGLNSLNSLNGLNGLNGLTAAGHGGLVALPTPAGHPTLALQQVLRRPHQPVPPPLAALIRAKKVRSRFCKAVGGGGTGRTFLMLLQGMLFLLSALSLLLVNVVILFYR